MDVLTEECRKSSVQAISHLKQSTLKATPILNSVIQMRAIQQLLPILKRNIIIKIILRRRTIILLTTTTCTRRF